MDRVPCFLASPLGVGSIILRIGLIASLFVFFGQRQASIILKAWEVNAAIKRKDSNCVGILSDEGKLQLLQTSMNILYIFASCKHQVSSSEFMVPSS